MKIAYFVHDLADPAVHRRVRMLRSFAEVTLLGFRRSEAAVADVEGLTPVDLGRTANARMAQRAAAVARAALTGGHWQAALAETTVFMARQLEVLVLAALARRRLAPGAPLVFECLDIHRLMVAAGPAGAALRMLEGRLLRSCTMLVVSSPAFLANHFDRYGPGPSPLVLENKVLEGELPPGTLERIADIRASGPAPGPPWRIGWFGVIRCRRSLHMLAELVRRMPGLVEVIIRGRPSRNVIPEFDDVVAGSPGLTFLGAYDRNTQLAAIYGEVHFTWAMDFYEQGFNSDWLLPNRLYEGSLYGAVPLALASVETGRWLAHRRCGVHLHENLDDGLQRFFAGLDPAGYEAARLALARVPLCDLVDGAATRARIAGALGALVRA